MRMHSVGDLGAVVRSARTAAGLTQAELALRTRVSRDWVVRLEKGHPRLEAQRVLEALDVLGVTLTATLPSEPSGAPEAGPDPFDELFGTAR